MTKLVVLRGSSSRNRKLTDFGIFRKKIVQTALQERERLYECHCFLEI